MEGGNQQDQEAEDRDGKDGITGTNETERRHQRHQEDEADQQRRCLAPEIGREASVGVHQALRNRREELHADREGDEQENVLRLPEVWPEGTAEDFLAKEMDEHDGST